MQKIDNFLNQIQDGTWHSLKKLSKNFKVPTKKLEKLSELLAAPNIVEYQPKKSLVKIGKKWQRLLENTNKEERNRKTAVCNIVLPPEKTITIQGVQLTNLLEMDIEVNVKANEKLEEIAISAVEKD